MGEEIARTPSQTNFSLPVVQIKVRRRGEEVARTPSQTHFPLPVVHFKVSRRGVASIPSEAQLGKSEDSKNRGFEGRGNGGRGCLYPFPNPVSLACSPYEGSQDEGNRGKGLPVPLPKPSFPCP